MHLQCKVHHFLSQRSLCFSVVRSFTLTGRRGQRSVKSDFIKRKFTLVPESKLLKKKSFKLDSILSDFESPLASVPLSENYEPFWQQQWNQRQLFNPDHQSNADTKSFSMILPPPNVTGDLHLGHALTVAIEDAIFRFTRMQNPTRKCVFVPGFDHAGIATQAVLDRRLWANQRRRVYDLSKPEFEEEAEKWKHERIESIRNQLNQLGAALDYTRETYTLDSKISKAVITAFVRLFDQGLLYRNETLVNWCFALNSTVSDLEVKWQTIDRPTKLRFPGHPDEFWLGYLYDLAYRVEGAEHDELIVSTTRPYSLPADVAVAVHPNDARYSAFVGKHVIHPLTNQRLPIVADEHVRPDFGSGVVKVTPCASLADFEIAARHRLPIGSLLNSKGQLSVPDLMNEFQFLNGLNRFEANDQVLRILNELKLFRGKRAHHNVIPLCSRTQDLIEYRLMPQWFLNMSPFNQKLRDLLSGEHIDFKPSAYKNSLLDWISHERDWCVSRQIWWGHQIPVYCADFADGRSPQWIAAEDAEQAYRKVTQKKENKGAKFTLTQSNDVLDTWFSSALLPFAVFGWPDKTQDLASFYPLNLIETGFDILKFWVHKMMALGWYLTGQMPFRRILLHGMIVDANGKKMSKSVGNVVNPTDMIEGATLQQMQQELDDLAQNGYMNEHELEMAKKNQRRLFPEGLPKNTADGLRLCLYQYDLHSEVIRLDKDNVKHNRNLINKIWQSFQLFHILSDAHTQNMGRPIEWKLSKRYLDRQWTQLDLLDKWILTLLNDFIDRCNQNLLCNHFHLVYQDFHQFWIENFCSTYLELIKPAFYVSKSDHDSLLTNRLHVLGYCFQTVMLAMHPMIPFVSEELYQRLQQIVQPLPDSFNQETYESVCQQRYPFMVVSPKCMTTAGQLKQTFEAVQTGSAEIRSLKNKFNIGKANGHSFHFEVRSVLRDRCRDLDGDSMLQILTRLPNVRFLADTLIDHVSSTKEKEGADDEYSSFVHQNHLVISNRAHPVQTLMRHDEMSGLELFDLYRRSMLKKRKTKKASNTL